MEANDSKTRPAPRWVPIAASAAVLLCTAVIVYVVFTNRPADTTGRSALDNIAEAIRPRVVERTVITGALARLHDEAKLVVLTAETDARVTKTSDKATFWGIDLGQTRVDLWASGNKVQYVLPLDEIERDWAWYDTDGNVLRVVAPEPVLDEQLIEVQSDPEKIRVQTELGWARLDRYSGQFLRREARKDLRPAVIEQGKSVLLVDRARNNAEILLEEKLRVMLADALPPEAEVEVEFR